MRLRLAFGILFVTFLAPAVTAGPAVRFIVTNDPCLIQVCPGDVPPPTTVEAGRSFQMFVVAVDAGNQVDRTYSGPAVVTSSDASAVLPAGLTFLQGAKEFTVVLMTLGNQTITVMDPIRGITGSFTITVTAPATVSVPLLNGPMRLLLISALAAFGVWLARTR